MHRGHEENFCAQHEDGPITCITDIVSRDSDGYVLTEIKSSTSAKPEHTFDLAFQRVVLEGAGLPISGCQVAHVNRDYVRTGQIDPKVLVAITDVTEAVDNQIENTRADSPCIEIGCSREDA